MPSARAKLKLATLSAAAPNASPPSSVGAGTVVNIGADGMIDVMCTDGRTRACAWLENGENQHVRLTAGDSVLLVLATDEAVPVVMGRIGRHVNPKPADHLKVEAMESITLVCGESSIDLRADGKVMIRGEDVLVRAKGTQRIRAGTVSIN